MQLKVSAIAGWTIAVTAGATLTAAGSTLGGAVAYVHPVPTTAPAQAERAVLKPRISPAPEYLTIAIINRQNGPISTSHASNVGGPSPIWGDDGPGTIPGGGAAAVVLPTGWAGNIAIFDAPTNGSEPASAADSSLIEASFVVSDGEAVAVADIDVSYVNGFSSAVTCACSGSVVTGYNLELWDLHACPNNNNGACVNPLRADLNATTATPFFAPCQGAAYTFPHDDGANSWGQCQSGEITCCVGTDCPPNVKQPPSSGS